MPAVEASHLKGGINVPQAVASSMLQQFAAGRQDLAWSVFKDV